MPSTNPGSEHIAHKNLALCNGIIATLNVYYIQMTIQNQILAKHNKGYRILVNKMPADPEGFPTEVLKVFPPPIANSDCTTIT